MVTIKGHEIAKQTKKDIIYVRMTKSMISELRDIRTKTGIPVSEIIRESVKRTLVEVSESGTLNFKLN